MSVTARDRPPAAGRYAVNRPGSNSGHDCSIAPSTYYAHKQRQTSPCDRQVRDVVLKALAEVELATAEWVDWYNHPRWHGEIGHVPPAEYEATYYLTDRKLQATTTK